MAIGPSDLSGAAARAGSAMATLEQVLNQADAQLGDGDTGSMLARLIAAIVAADIAGSPTVGAAFRTAARAATSATGSSLGTLVATAFMTMGKEAGQREAIDWADLGPMMKSATSAMYARGGATRGDKTMLDAFEAVADAITGLEDGEAVAAAAVREGRATLESFRGRPCRIGRARMFAEKSSALDDPGMQAFVALTEAVAAA